MLKLADRLWRGETSVAEHHPLFSNAPLAEVGDAVAFIASFANVTAITTDAGLVLVDTGSPFTAAAVHETVRAWTLAPLHTAVYSHGHIDHVFGVPVFAAEAADAGWPAPRVIAHEALPARFDRYVLTSGYNAVINQRQFGVPGLQWPTEWRYPDETYRDLRRVEVGGVTLELHHARGETDDHTWTWVPERKLLCCGDLFIWCVPNAGNPQKVQRYPREWAVALRAMAELGAETLLPGHGLPVVGAERITAALTDTAALLESLHDQTVSLMNQGAALNTIVHEVRAPSALLEKPYLRPIYDDPEFIVRNVWRLYGGWYDGNPAHLKPALDAELAAEVVALAGGAERLAERARELADAGASRLAAHLVEMAAEAAPDHTAVQAARADVYEQRVAEETSLMAKGIFGAAARQSRSRSE